MGSNSLVINNSMGILIYRACIEVEGENGFLTYNLVEKKMKEYIKICDKKSKIQDVGSLKADLINAQNFIVELKANGDSVYDLKSYAKQTLNPTAIKTMEDSVARVLKK